MYVSGKNVMDFFDPEIEDRLNALEEEEAQLEASGAYAAAAESDEDDEIGEEDMLLYEAIKVGCLWAYRQNQIALRSNELTYGTGKAIYCSSTIALEHTASASQCPH